MWDDAIIAPIERYDGVFLEGDRFNYPSILYHEGMIVIEGGVFDELERGLTLPYCAFVPTRWTPTSAHSSDRLHYYHEVVGHGSQEWYGPFYLPVVVATYITQMIIDFPLPLADPSHSIENNWIEDKANTLRDDYLLTHPHLPFQP